MKKYFRNLKGIFESEKDDQLKWVETLTPEGIDHYHFLGTEDNIKDLILPNDIIKIKIPGETPEADPQEFMLQVIDAEGVPSVEYNGNVVPISDVDITELWTKFSGTFYIVATVGPDGDLVPTGRLHR